MNMNAKGGYPFEVWDELLDTIRLVAMLMFISLGLMLDW